MPKHILEIIIILFGIVVSHAFADTVYLKNGRCLEGIVKYEDSSKVELEVGGGNITFKRAEVSRITKNSPDEAGSLRKAWEEQQVLAKEKLKEKQLKALAMQAVPFTEENKSMVIRTKINNGYEAKLIFDTGATLLMLTRKAAEKLGINVDELEKDMKLTMGDGRNVQAKFLTLSSVKTAAVEAYDVDACVFVDEKLGPAGFDGLLGMSFLGRFNFRIDHDKNMLILEKK